MSDFSKFKDQLQKHFTTMLEGGRLYELAIDGDAFWELYLNSFPKGTNEMYRKRREYDCSCCRSFIKRYGKMVTIKDSQIISLWDVKNVDYPFNEVVKTLQGVISKAVVENIFVSKEAKLGTDKNHELVDGKDVATWEHFFLELPRKFVDTTSSSIGELQGAYRDSKNVFHRSMEELTLDAGNTILELIEQGSLYRGEEHKKNITEFIAYKTKYNKVPQNKKELWCWENAMNPVSRIRNTALGTLLIDLSEGTDLDVAITKFEKVMAPTNYKRPTSIITKRMIEDAQKKIEELGYVESLGRRFSVPEDLTVNNVLYVNRNTKKKIGGSVFDDMKSEVAINPKTLGKVEEIGIEDFIKNILPTATNLELMMDNSHQGNLFSLISPINKEAPSMLKWKSNHSWVYKGDIADSMKQNVKNAGGNVEGILRFSIQWNDEVKNSSDFDIHCIEPNRNEIYFMNKASITSGRQDVDIISPTGVAVENITWTDSKRMLEGKYIFAIHNYNHRGNSGFSAEIEYGGQIYSYHYEKNLRQDETVVVAEVMFSKKDGLTFIKSLDSTTASKEVWGVKTHTFSKVSMCMYSPNYWDDQVEIGNKHYFFVLEDCKNDTTPRGFFNEFLKEELTKHRKVFEVLGSKMKVEPSDAQLSGLGFSSTQRNSIIAKVDGSFSRTIKIIF